MAKVSVYIIDDMNGKEHIKGIDLDQNEVEFIVSAINSHLYQSDFIGKSEDDISRQIEHPESNKNRNFLIKIYLIYKQKNAGELVRSGIAEAKERGEQIGNPQPNLKGARSAYSTKAARFRSAAAPLIEELSGKGLSLRAIARRLNEHRVPTERGRSWHASSVRRVLLEREIIKQT